MELKLNIDLIAFIFNCEFELNLYGIEMAEIDDPLFSCFRFELNLYGIEIGHGCNLIGLMRRLN